jgi:hypothetical protein
MVCTEATQELTDKTASTAAALVGSLVGAYLVVPGIIQSIMSTGQSWINTGAYSMAFAFVAVNKITNVRSEFLHGSGPTALLYQATGVASMLWVTSDLIPKIPEFFSWIGTSIKDLWMYGGNLIDWTFGTVGAFFKNIAYSIGLGASEGKYPEWLPAPALSTTNLQAAGGGEIKADSGGLSEFGKYLTSQIYWAAIRQALQCAASLLLKGSNATYLPKGLRKLMAFLATLARGGDVAVDLWQIYEFCVLPANIIIASLTSDEGSIYTLMALWGLRIAMTILAWLYLPQVKKWITGRIFGK